MLKGPVGRSSYPSFAPRKTSRLYCYCFVNLFMFTVVSFFGWFYCAGRASSPWGRTWSRKSQGFYRLKTLCCAWIMNKIILLTFCLESWFWADRTWEARAATTGGSRGHFIFIAVLSQAKLSAASAEWPCDVCTFINTNPSRSTCEVTFSICFKHSFIRCATLPNHTKLLLKWPRLNRCLRLQVFPLVFFTLCV